MHLRVQQNNKQKVKRVINLLCGKKGAVFTKKKALQNVVSKDSAPRNHDKCLTYCESHISEIFTVFHFATEDRGAPIATIS